MTCMREVCYILVALAEACCGVSGRHVCRCSAYREAATACLSSAEIKLLLECKISVRLDIRAGFLHRFYCLQLKRRHHHEAMLAARQ